MRSELASAAPAPILFVRRGERAGALAPREDVTRFTWSSPNIGMADLRVIGVAGASGGLGGRIAARLAARGVEQRLIVRDPSRAPSHPGAEVVQGGDYGDGDAMRRASTASRSCSCRRRASTPTASRSTAARSTPPPRPACGRLVYTSFVGAAPDCVFTFGRDHFHTEEHIRGLGRRLHVPARLDVPRVRAVLRRPPRA